MATDTDLDKSFLYNQLDAYPWSSDEEFQGGLRAILGSVQDPSQIEHLTLRAKCYYFARKSGTPVDFDGYKQWVENPENFSAPVANGSHAVYDSLVEGEMQPHARPGAETNEIGDDGGGMGGMGAAPKPASFAEICALIQEGKPIPGIKDIPETILEGQASDSSTERRKKPWEKDGVSRGQVVEQPSWMR